MVKRIKPNILLFDMEKRVIDQELEKYLIDIASRLPVIPVKTEDGKGVKMFSRVLGAALIQNNITFQDGGRIQPSKFYNIEVGKVHINHLKNLKKAFMKDGPKGTADYIRRAKLGLL